jgi:hypothetical protein
MKWLYFILCGSTGSRSKQRSVSSQVTYGAVKRLGSTFRSFFFFFFHWKAIKMLTVSSVQQTRTYVSLSLKCDECKETLSHISATAQKTPPFCLVVTSPVVLNDVKIKVKLQNEELHNLYSSPRRMRWAGNVARMRRGMHI